MQILIPNSEPKVIESIWAFERTENHDIYFVYADGVELLAVSAECGHGVAKAATLTLHESLVLAYDNGCAEYDLAEVLEALKVQFPTLTTV